MRIVIDLQGAQSLSRFRGIGRYSLALTQGIIRNRGQHEIILVLSGILRDSVPTIVEFFAPILSREQIRVWYAPGPVAEIRQGTELRREAAKRMREAFITSLKPDLIHISSFFEGWGDDAVATIGPFMSADGHEIPVSVSLYDLIPFLNQADYLDIIPGYKSIYLAKVADLKKVPLLLSISDFSRQEGIEHLHIAPEKIVNISSAADDFFTDQAPSTDPQALFDKFQITKPFALYTGGADARKNLKRLLLAYASLPLAIRQEHQLVLAGVIAHEELVKLQEILKVNGIQPGEVIFTDYITDKELHTLYFTCKLFIFPSWHEGFGLPALEAMKSGAAVIASNVTSIPEVIGIDEAFFDPFSVESIAQKIAAGLSDEALRTRLIVYGKAKAKEFSWDITGQKAMAAFEKVYAKHQAQLQAQTSKPAPLDISNSALRNHVLNQLISDSPDAVFQKYKPHNEDLLRLSVCISQNFPADDRKPQFLVDISQLITVDEKTGIQRVVRSLITEFLANPPANWDVKLVYSDRFSLGYRYATKFSKQFSQQATRAADDRVDDKADDELIETQPGDVFFGLDLQSENIQIQKQYLNALFMNGTKIYYVVYDLLPLYFPKAFPETVDHLHAQWLREISKYDGIYCISKAVADEFKVWSAKNIPTLSPKFDVNWFHLGADIESSAPTKGMPPDAHEVIAQIKARPSFIMIGTIEPRKGYKQALAAFEKLWAKGVDVNLVIIGKHGWLMDEFANDLPKHPEFGKHFFWLNRISDEYLEALYAAGTCLLLASQGEGFGLPLIEAARRHLPIIARDIPVFREVAGDHAYYFQCDLDNDAASGSNTTPATEFPLHNLAEADQIASSIEAWLALYQAGKHPKSDQMPWLTWKESAQSILKSLLK